MIAPSMIQWDTHPGVSMISRPIIPSWMSWVISSTTLKINHFGPLSLTMNIIILPTQISKLALLTMCSKFTTQLVTHIFCR